ncbi:MAG: hypothetical protein GFH27_549281n430 [Chloroflexi bacterium AL-W]|nr:hypothetical protein [Chloroflexi bacterium AL-N1]NOK70923.1 hypothetical protein [Chloroflexi bacterium AL-N10]NOK73196.1 hypothetical protein [Chloroflexi bacterium AL-N5]NOK80093.1 hypothetical protein [Chloroflexi bacterium AL-W]NOK88052.1 hypothetical protein [Chloroflexi bacterium AL-N15]
MHRPLIRASMLTLLTVLLLSVALPTLVVVPPSSAAPLNEIPPPPTDAELLSEGKPAAADYYCSYNGCMYPELANDGDVSTWWSTYIPPPGEATDEVPWTVDLGATYELTRIDAIWAPTYYYHPDRYRVAVSDDNSTFTTVLTRTAVTEKETSDVLQARGRYVRVLLSNDMTMWRYAHEIQIYGREVGPLDLTVTDSAGQTVDALALNSDGWPATNAATGAVANPITVTMTISNTTDAPVTYNPQLIIGERDGPARFYVFDQPGSPQCLPRVESFSTTFFEDSCSAHLDPGRARTFTWGLWIQPSDTVTLSVTAALREGSDPPIATRTRTVDIPQAAIHPLVFLPGLGATIPPTNTGNPDDVLWIGNIFANYNTFYEYLERMGYERDKTYFLFPYDWLRSTMEAASYLQPKLISWATIAGNTPGVGRDPISNRVTFDLVGHSTGNLVTRAYVQGDHWPGDALDNVNKWVSIAGPLQGVSKSYKGFEGSRPDLGKIEKGVPFVVDGLNAWIRQRAEQAGYYTPTTLGFSRLTDEGLYLFVHDPENGFTILPEFLPTYGDYLFGAGSGSPHPYGRLANTLLESSTVVNGTLAEARLTARREDLSAMEGKVYDPYLHNPWVVETDFPRQPLPDGFQTRYHGLNTPAKMALLEQRIGADNICIVYGGDGTEDTTYGHAVATPLTMAPHWLNGMVGNDSYKAIGDNLITADSANPRGAVPSGIWTVNVPDQNRFELEGTLERQISHRTIVGEHASISATTQCLTDLVPPFLFEQFPQTATTTATTPIQSLLIYAPGPVELLLTDAQGRRLGYDPDSGTIVEEIPDALYYQNPDEPAVTLFIYGADLGDYDITVTGTATGDYEVIGWYEDDTATIDLVYEEGSTAAGASSQIDIEVPHDTRDVPTPPQVQAGPNLNVTVGQAVTFAGAFSDINPDDSHTIAWDFGDRTMSASSLTPEHTYIATGQYTATLTITDSTNFVVEDSLFVDVTGPALAPLSFTEPVTYSSRVGPYGALTLADGNNDTIPDIIGSDGIAGSRQLVSALSGNGDGSFAPPEFIELDSVYGVAVADFDGDQLADMALAHQLSLFILPGRGVGQWPRFDPDALRYTSESFRSPITADFNGDGRPDLTTSNIATRDVEIWYGNGDGTFQASVRYAGGALPFSLVSSDLTGDGLPDLMIANAGDNSVSVLINTGDQFTAAVTYPVGDYPMMVTAADFNGDGSPDLATANGRDDTISILFNDSTGQLQSALPVPLKQHPHSITTGDLNSDGALDIIVGTNRTVAILLGYGDGTFHTAHSYAIPGLVSSMDVADLDADGNDDLVVLNMHYGEVNVFLQR